jgi:hypothetical protein
MGDESANVRKLEVKLTKLISDNVSRNAFETLASRTQDVATAVVRIETGLLWQEKFLKYSVVGAVAWLGFLTYFIIATMGRVSTLEGKGGSYQATERALQKSDSPEDASTNLDLLAAQVGKRAISADPLSNAALAQVGVTVSGVADKYPQLPDVWRVAARLVTLRSDRNQSLSDNLPNCWTTYARHSEGEVLSRPGAVLAEDQHVGNCQLSLDYNDAFKNSGFGKVHEGRLVTANSLNEPLILRIYAHDAVVTYSGGSVIPFGVFQCVRCSFKISSQVVPPPHEGAGIFKQLMIADLTDTVSLASTDQTVLKSN